MTPRAADEVVYMSLWLGGVFIWLAGSAYLARSEGLPPGRVALLLALEVPIAFIGARIHSLMFEVGLPLGDLLHDPMIFFGAGLRLPGGILLALIASPILAFSFRLPLGRLFDCSAPFVGMISAFGRLGCFTQGCCHGRLSDLPWAVAFDPGTEVFRNHVTRALIQPGVEYSLPVHPLQLYMSAAAMALTVVMLWVRGRHRTFSGEVATIAAALFGWTLAGLEMLRETKHARHVPWRLEFYLIMAALATCVWIFTKIYHARRAV